MSTKINTAAEVVVPALRPVRSAPGIDSGLASPPIKENMVTITAAMVPMTRAAIKASREDAPAMYVGHGKGP